MRQASGRSSTSKHSVRTKGCCAQLLLKVCDSSESIDVDI